VRSRAAVTAGAAGVAAFPAAAAILLLLLPLTIAGAGPGSPASSVCGPGGTGQVVGGVALDAEQMGNAQVVVSAVAQRRLPAYAATLALATVAAESMFHNDLVFRDADSLGLFQQRVRYYGAPVAADPVRATDAFLDRLVMVDRWATRPLTDVVAAVQRPRADLRGAYAKWAPLAAALTAQLWPRAAGAMSAPPIPAPSIPTATIPTATIPTATIPAVTTPMAPVAGRFPVLSAPPDPCGVVGTGPGGGSAAIPRGLVLDGSPAGNRAAAFALAQLTKPYVWGSDGPSSWDCSALVQAGWAWAGVAIGRTTFAQVNAGTPVALTEARSGDLVFIAGTDGTASSPGHVGMVAGRAAGATYLVEAPHSGAYVQMTPATQWAGLIVSVRRIG
jgi:cell wall-associated NlpC family hydrolase